MTITGLEQLQEVYASPAFREERFENAVELADLLVVIKFQSLIQKAASHMRLLRFPLLATAHDWDFIAEVLPGNRE
jgi:hypothetical protein